MMPTRSQEMMQLAIKHVKAVEDIEHTLAGNKRPICRKYKDLCHTLPCLVRACGLCQSVAFVESKAVDTDAEARAHRFVLQNMSEMLTAHGILLQDTDLSMAISSLSTQEYIHATRTILKSWVFYKRFSESLLGVEIDDAERNR